MIVRARNHSKTELGNLISNSIFIGVELSETARRSVVELESDNMRCSIACDRTQVVQWSRKYGNADRFPARAELPGTQMPHVVEQVCITLGDAENDNRQS